jgi:peroxiredoxin Q/BCP
MVLSVLASLVLSATPKVGDLAPDFTATDSDGNPVQLSQLLKDGPVILAFFPKAFTGGCTKELTAYRDRYSDVEQRGAKVVAISMDDVAKMKEFKASLKATYVFLPDPDGKVVKLYDVKMPLLPAASRTTFVVNPDGKIADIKSGSDAIDPGGSLQACPLHKPAPAKTTP